MGRTRGSSTKFHQDDGVLLGKGGVPIPAGAVTTQMTPAAYPDGMPIPLDRQGAPISPAVAKLAPVQRLSGNVVLQGPGAEPVASQPAITSYRADSKSWGRSMEAWELARLLDLAFRHPGDLGDGFVVNLTPDEYVRLDGNLRRHFMAVRSE